MKEPTALQLAAAMQPPYSNEAEQAVIASVLSQNDWFPIVSAFLKAEHFYILRHQYIWEAFERLYSKRMALDYLTVTEDLKALGRFEDVGGSYYLIQLNAPTSVNAPTYGRMVLEQWLRRRMLDAAHIIQAVALAGEFDVDEARGEMSRQTALVMGVELSRPEKSLMELALERQEFIERQMTDKSLLLGLSWGITALDEITAGLHPSDLTIVAGVAGMGKTSLMLSAALFQAKLGKITGIVSQEMNDAQIWDRLTSLETGIDLQKIRTGNLTGDEYTTYLEASLMLKSLGFRIYAKTVTPDQLQALCLKWLAQGGLDVLYVDYLQIMSSGGQFKTTQRAQEVGYFARRLKALAKETNTRVVAGAQLNRETTGIPELRHLRDSGEIEQEADNVVFIYRPDYYSPQDRAGQADLIVAKQRNGPTGTATCAFDKPSTKYKNADIQRINFRTGEYE